MLCRLLDRFPSPEKKYRSVLERKIKISMRGKSQSIFKMVGAIIQSKTCYLLLTKEIQFFL